MLRLRVTSVDIICSVQRQQESVTKADIRLLHYARVEQKERRLSARGKHEDGSQLKVGDVVEGDQGQTASDGADSHPNG